MIGLSLAETETGLQTIRGQPGVKLPNTYNNLWRFPMFAHPYRFDPSYGYSLDALLSIAAPDEPPAFADFWCALQQQAQAVIVNPQVREVRSPIPELRVFEVAFTSLDAMRIGGWITYPRDGRVERGAIVGHGYGGRETPDFALPFQRAAVIFPCARGIARSATPALSSNPLRHILHGIRHPETYILGACAADTVWCAATTLLQLFPQAAQCLDYMGISFGGGVGALAIPWDGRFHRAHLHVPSFGHHPLRLTMDCVGSGAALRSYQRRTGKALDTLRYFDAALTAKYLHIPLHVAAALFDPAVPPPGQFAIYNAAPQPKQLLVLQAGHFDYAEMLAEQERLRTELEQFFK